jgi:hypothetical protein
MNRKRLLLAVLAGLLTLSLIYAFWAMPRQEKAPPRAAESRPGVRTKAPGKVGKLTADRLHLGLLAQAPQPFPDAGRDIFRFRGGWAPPVDVPVVVAPRVEVAPPPPPPPPPPTPEQILQQKVSGFTFLGFLDKGGVKTVFLSGEGELYLVKAGDHFGKRGDLLAQEISASELVIRAAEGTQTVRVRLVENEGLKLTLIGSRSVGAGAASTEASSGMRPDGGGTASRRSILPQRGALRRPQPEATPETGEDVEQGVQPPDDGVKQEELLRQGTPGGEGNGHKE